MYCSDIDRQTFTLEGITYTPDCFRRPGDNPFPANDPFRQELFLFLVDWFAASPEIEVHTSGSTGSPKALRVRKKQMIRSAETTCSFLHLQRADKVLLCLPLSYIAGKMIVVRALTAGLDVYPAAPSGHPLAATDTVFRFAAMIPLQVYNSLRVPAQKEKLQRIGTLIVGGGPVDRALAKAVAGFPNAVYSTYGMTETLSHIALRRLNGPDASERYVPFAGVGLSLSEAGTLIVQAPAVCDRILATNDVARLHADGSFEILGRCDNTINTGGVKVQAEEVEERLHPFVPAPFAVTSQPHPKFGQIVVLLVEGAFDPERLNEVLRKNLPLYQVPKKIGRVDRLPFTSSGKIDRAEIKRMAATL